MAKNNLSVAWLVKPGNFIKQAKTEEKDSFWEDECFKNYPNQSIDLAAKDLEVYQHLLQNKLLPSLFDPEKVSQKSLIKIQKKCNYAALALAFKEEILHFYYPCSTEDMDVLQYDIQRLENMKENDVYNILPMV